MFFFQNDLEGGWRQLITGAVHLVDVNHEAKYRITGNKNFFATDNSYNKSQLFQVKNTLLQDR
jgi:hypothetical protein